MDGVLSQEEINALLNNNDAADSSDEILTESEKDAIGEIANFSTDFSTLFCKPCAYSIAYIYNYT